MAFVETFSIPWAECRHSQRAFELLAQGVERKYRKRIDVCHSNPFWGPSATASRFRRQRRLPLPAARAKVKGQAGDVTPDKEGHYRLTHHHHDHAIACDASCRRKRAMMRYRSPMHTSSSKRVTSTVEVLTKLSNEKIVAAEVSLPIAVSVHLIIPSPSAMFASMPGRDPPVRHPQNSRRRDPKPYPGLAASKSRCGLFRRHYKVAGEPDID